MSLVEIVSIVSSGRRRDFEVFVRDGFVVDLSVVRISLYTDKYRCMSVGTSEGRSDKGGRQSVGTTEGPSEGNGRQRGQSVETADGRLVGTAEGQSEGNDQTEGTVGQDSRW